MIMLYNAGYIDGIDIIHLGGNECDLKYIDPSITLKGLEYLEQNELMHKAYRLLKGIKDVAPGM